MNILSRPRIKKFMLDYPNAKDALELWYREVKKAEWDSSQDIKDRYPKASLLGNKIVIFDIKGTHYRLVVSVAYKTKHVYVKWFGTHAEYDKRDFEKGG
jgi:mRNA interferase HigB